MQPDQYGAVSARGFFASLYDFSFAAFVTPKMVRIIYVVALIAAALWCLGILLTGFTTFGLAMQLQSSPYGRGGAGLALLGLGEIIGAPILFVVFSIVARMQLEVLIAVFRIAENTTAMAQAAERPAVSAP